mmetsp:Transcript_100610/g.285052  ORF Transcript_100610/g.285052 Transcript_100610/m.285052 type:complete len:217 (-) Transcript_100610:1337-1987(-)
MCLGISDHRSTGGPVLCCPEQLPDAREVALVEDEHAENTRGQDNEGEHHQKLPDLPHQGVALLLLMLRLRLPRHRLAGRNGALTLQDGLDLLLLVPSQVGELKGYSLDSYVSAHHVPEDAVRVVGRVQQLRRQRLRQAPAALHAAHDERLAPARGAVLVHRPSPIHKGMGVLGHPQGDGVVQAPQPQRQVSEVLDLAAAKLAVVKVSKEVDLALVA